MWGGEPSPPPAASARRCFTLQPRGSFTSRHGNLGQCQVFSHERVTPVAFTLEISASAGHAGLETILFHFKRRKFGLHPLDLRIQGVDVRRLGAR